MKKNENKKKIKDYQNKLSPKLQRKKYYFSKNLIQDYEINNIILSPKKSQDELILPKKKIPNTSSHHRRTKSNSQNYIDYLANKNINLNTSISKLSFIFGKKELENNYNYSSVSRNKKFKNNFNENKKSSNLLSISFSLKDFRNNIKNVFSNKNTHETKNNNEKNINIFNLKNSKSIFSFDNITNIEETRNTTSITNFNNSNLIYNKHLNNKDKETEKSKSTKYIKINQKVYKQSYSSKNYSSKIITFTNNNNTKIEKNGNASPKFNLHKYNKNNNISNKLKNTNNLILTKNTFENNKKFFSKEKIFNISPISELDNDDNFYIIERKNNMNKNNFSPIGRNLKIKKIKKGTSPKYKKRKAKSLENNCKININCNNRIGEFKSVEEIHFIFVYINQKKKEFFEKNLIEKKWNKINCE
jgi:hypothetical protein